MNFTSDILIIGTGWAGFAAAIEAASQGLSVTLIEKSPGATTFSSGALDIADSHLILGNFSTGNLNIEKNLELIFQNEVQHPYARLVSQLGLGVFQDFLRESIRQTTSALPIHWSGDLERNRLQITSLGNLKATALVQESMQDADVLAMNKAKVLVVGIQGFPLFNSAFVKNHLLEIQSEQPVPYIQFAGNLDVEIPALVSSNSLTDFEIARTLDEEANFVPFAQSLLSYLQGKVYTHVLLPPLMGLVNVELIIRTLKKITGLQVAECLAYQMNIPGLRLRNAMKQSCEARGIQIVSGEVKTVNKQGGEIQSLELESQQNIIRLDAKAFILATGKFLGGGIQSHLAFEENIFHAQLGLSRQGSLEGMWKFGLITNEFFQPSLNGEYMNFENLFAAGSILPGYDYIRGRCGGGTAIVTGVFAARNAIAKLRNLF